MEEQVQSDKKSDKYFDYQRQREREVFFCSVMSTHSPLESLPSFIQAEIVIVASKWDYMNS